MDSFIGDVKLFAGDFAPRDWLFCNGKLMPIDGNEALFSLLQTRYGGDGRTTFALPDMKSVAGGGEGAVQYIICMAGAFPTRG